MSLLIVATLNNNNTNIVKKCSRANYKIIML